MMNCHKNMIYRTVAALLVTVFCCPLSVFASSSTSVTNKGSVGAVDISLQYDVDTDTGAILPNQNVDLKSSVTNLAEPAWLRVKIQYPVYQNEQVLDHLKEENLTDLDDSLITFGNRDWRKIGSYYYLETPVMSGETVPFTEAIQFPPDWDNRLINSKFGICITAEAIQEKNFTPDFQSDDPWLGAVIECYDSTDYIHRGAGLNRFSVVYEGGAEGLVRTGDDFFSNWETLMPGDTVTGEAAISNHMECPVNLFFAMQPSYGDDVKTERLLHSLHLVVRHGGTVIYDGNLWDSYEERLLQEYAPGESGTLSYELTVPAELNNEFAESDFQTVWTFRAQEILPEPEQEIIKTGDLLSVLRLGGCIAAITVCIGIGIYFKKRKGWIK